METSAANAGQISPGYSAPWAAPGVPQKVVGWLFQRHAPLALRWDGTMYQLEWMAKLLANCNDAAYALNKGRMMRLAEYSRDVMRVLSAEAGVTYEGRRGGTLQLFRTQAQVAAMAKDVAVLRDCGVPHNALDPDGCVREEPALAAVRHKLAGGLQLPNDETGDCRIFTEGLAAAARAAGVAFRFGTRVDAIECSSEGSCGKAEGQRVTGVRVSPSDGGVTVAEAAELLTADAFVVALGSYSRALVRRLGLDLPVYPVKGYSLTVPIADAAAAPVSTVLDETYKVAVTRFDARVRVGGMAELSGYNAVLDPRRRATLEMVVRDLFPGCGDAAQAAFWTGLRPMTPDGTPLVCASPAHRNLWLNTGHGTLGWTMCAGSGRVLADLVTGAAPEIDAADLSLARYAKLRA